MEPEPFVYDPAAAESDIAIAVLIVLACASVMGGSLASFMGMFRRTRSLFGGDGSDAGDAGDGRPLGPGEAEGSREGEYELFLRYITGVGTLRNFVDEPRVEDAIKPSGIEERQLLLKSTSRITGKIPDTVTS